MPVVETIARIRREHFMKGKTIKGIARDLKVSRTRSGRCCGGETSFSSTRDMQPRPKLRRWAVGVRGFWQRTRLDLLVSS